MRAELKDQLVPNLASAGAILAVALCAAHARRLGLIDDEMKTRVIALNGLWIAWYGNRLPKAFVPNSCARRVRRVTGWSLTISGVIYAGAFLFAPLPVALPVGTAAILLGIGVSAASCLRWGSRTGSSPAS